LPHDTGGNSCHATVKRQVKDAEGNYIERSNKYPILDSRQYEVDYVNGRTEILIANIITQNIIARLDVKGHCQMLFDDII